MDLSEMQTRVAELEQQISVLPAGSITKKTVRGKDYFYHRWTENKKRREKYIPADELENFRAQIERRKVLEQKLKALKKQLPKTKAIDTSIFTTNIRTGEALRSFAAPVRDYRKRECFRQLYDFVYGVPQDKDAAYDWFQKAQAQGHDYAGFFVDRIERPESPNVLLSATRLLYHMGKIFQSSAPAPQNTGVQIDRKRLAKLRRMRMAAGHKADDHEQEQTNNTMSMGW